MVYEIVFMVGLIAVGCHAILHEDKFIAFERRAFKWLKRKLFPTQVIVVPGESEAHKQARFDSGVQAANELYAK